MLPRSPFGRRPGGVPFNQPLKKMKSPLNRRSWLPDHVVQALEQNREALVEAWVDHVQGTEGVLKLDADARFQFHVGDAATVVRDNQPPVRLGPEAEVHVRFAAGQPSSSKSIVSMFEENWDMSIPPATGLPDIGTGLPIPGTGLPGMDMTE